MRLDARSLEDDVGQHRADGVPARPGPESHALGPHADEDVCAWLEPALAEHGTVGRVDRHPARRIEARDLARNAAREADELEREGRRRPAVDRVGRVILLDPAAIHHRDPVGHDQRLVLIVRHEDRRGAELAQQPPELDLHRLAQLAVERGEGLVEQQQLRPDGERPRHGHALLLPAGQRLDRTVGERRHMHEVEEAGDRRRDLARRSALGLQAEGDVLRDCQVRKERVALEDDADVALVRRQARELAPIERDGARIRRREAGHDPEQRGLAAARGAEQRHELGLADRKIDAVQHRTGAEILRRLPDVEESVLAHGRGRSGHDAPTAIPLRSPSRGPSA